MHPALVGRPPSFLLLLMCHYTLINTQEKAQGILLFRGYGFLPFKENNTERSSQKDLGANS